MAALDGVRVVDLSQQIAAPYCTQVLADLGAEVIKVEEPTIALLTRMSLSPPGVDENRRFSGVWLSNNRNKKSLTLDLKAPGATAVLADLVRASDVVVENFPGRSRQSLGIDETWGFSIRKEIVWASLTGYGRTGPDAERGSWDLIAQARGGLLDMTGEPDGPPVKSGNSAADYLAGLHLAVGIIAALHQRARTGEGQLVDVSLLDSVVACLDGLPMWYSIGGVTPHRTGNFHPAKLPAYSVFQTRDGYITIGALGPSLSRLMALLEHPELGVAMPPAGVEERGAWFEQVVQLISSWTSERTRDEISAILDDHGVPNEPVRDVAELWSDRQLQARGSFLEYEHFSLGPIRTIGSPIHMSGSPIEVRYPPPQAGEHNDQVLRDLLSYDDGQIAELVENGTLWGSTGGRSQSGT
jgi:formyl-CoA transferase/CoA:oxalate CoA-transferase